MKAISIKNPWAALIAQGLKTIEVRSWRTSHRGQIIIVSSAKPDSIVKADFKRTNDSGAVYTYLPHDPENGEFAHYGHAVAIAELTHITEFRPDHTDAAMIDHAPGLFAWHLKNVREIEPFEVKGKLSIYDIDYKEKRKDMKKLKMNQSVQLTYEEAKELVKNTEAEYEFNNLNESTITDTVEFETVQNRKYYVTKIEKKGTVINRGSEWETKLDVGIFELEMTYDFRHPSNFALNDNNVSRIFRIEF